MVDDIDWTMQRHAGGQTKRVMPSIVSRGHDTKDVPQALVDDIIKHCVARLVCPDCSDDSYYFMPMSGTRTSSPECQGCGAEFFIR